MMREERNKIDRLLESFYAGTTSPQEELELYCLLEGLPDAAPYHSDLQLLWALIGLPERETAMEDDSDKVLLEKMASWEDRVRHPSRRLSLRLVRYGAVACVALALAIGVAVELNTVGRLSSNRNGIALDRDEAVRETAYAMELLEYCLDRGADAEGEFVEMLGWEEEALYAEAAMSEEEYERNTIE